MEGLIEKFLSVSSGFGDGLSSGFGYGSGLGSGCGAGSGCGDGSGLGSGDGCGDGSGLGAGSGSGYGDDIIEFEGQKVWYIDGISTIIIKIRNNIAKGFILNQDLTLSSCYIAKVENCFAHGLTIKEAVRQAIGKALQSMPGEKRIEEFWKCHNEKKKYPARDLWIWHNRLTGSCEMGRNQFAKERGIDIDKDEFTVKEFVEMCENHYGGEIISKLKEKL